MNRRTKGIAIGTLMAGAMGYVAGILTAPKSGSETRQSIRSAKRTAFIEGERKLKQLHTELGDLLAQVNDLAKHGVSKQQMKVLQEDVVTGATRTRQKTREILSALHDGSADDNDLDKAISEAVRSIKSIRAYLKK